MQDENQVTQIGAGSNATLAHLPPPDDLAHLDHGGVSSAPAGNTGCGANTPATELPWPDPAPIKHDLRPVLTLDAEMLPEPLRPWVADIARRMQCPIDFVAATVVVMVSSVIGAGCAIRPKLRDDWKITPNLWGGVVAPPSMLKSPSMAEALKPLVRLEIEAKSEYDRAIQSHAAELEMHEIEKEALKQRATKQVLKNADAGVDAELKSRYAALGEPAAPQWKRYMSNDSTIEKMAELMVQNPRGLLYHRDELTGMLTSWDREGREQDRAFHLQAWNGDSGYITDRIKRGTICVNIVCESIFGGIQPSKLLIYLQQAVKNTVNDGLMQRFQLLVYPDQLPNWKLIDDYPDSDAKERAFAVVKKLAAMDFVACGAIQFDGEEIPFFRFADEAQEFFYGWLTRLEMEKLRDPHEEPIVVEHLGKYRKLMPSLSLIFHLVEVADGIASGAVSLQSAVRAARWCDYLETHARRIYGLVGDASRQAAFHLAKKLKDGLLVDGFSARDIYRKGWGQLSDPELVKAAIDELVDAGWLRQKPLVVDRAAGRPPAPEYEINPKVKKAQDERE